MYFDCVYPSFVVLDWELECAFAYSLPFAYSIHLSFNILNTKAIKEVGALAMHLDAWLLILIRKKSKSNQMVAFVQAVLLCLGEQGGTGPCYRDTRSVRDAIQLHYDNQLWRRQKQEGKARPHFACCLVLFLIDSDWFLVSLNLLLTNAASMPLEAPCSCLGDCGHKGLEWCWVPWYDKEGELEDNDWKEVEEKESCKLFNWPSHHANNM